MKMVALYLRSICGNQNKEDNLYFILELLFDFISDNVNLKIKFKFKFKSINIFTPRIF
jgi:hypothetical protein